MDHDFKLDVDQAGELKAAFRRGGWSNREVKRLCEGDVLANVRRVMMGHAEIREIGNYPFIDCSQPGLPHTYEMWVLRRHNTYGEYRFDPVGMKLIGLKGVRRRSVFDQVPFERSLNACVLHFLLQEENRHLIPESWRGKRVLFMGTVYECENGKAVKTMHYQDYWPMVEGKATVSQYDPKRWEVSSIHIEDLYNKRSEFKPNDVAVYI